MLRPLLLFVLFVNAAAAQVSTFSQPGANFGKVNPAFTVHTEARTIGLASRLQWPGTEFFSSTNTLFYNHYFPKIHSGLGVNLGYTAYNHNKFASRTAAIRYAYKILFLERFYLCAGLGVNYENEKIDVNNYRIKYEPKKNFAESPSRFWYSENITGEAGLLFLDPSTNQFAGVSFKTISLYNLDTSKYNSFEPAGHISVHGRGRYLVTRKTMLLIYLNYEHTWETSFNNLGKTIPAYSGYMANLSFFFDRNKLIGVGYKYFPDNYGSLNYHFAYAPANTRITLGYSFDTKAYIQYDKIHFNNSHEFFLKYRLPGEIY
jgi:type IX secretion system PorP/SprF family membrane protein